MLIGIESVDLWGFRHRVPIEELIRSRLYKSREKFSRISRIVEHCIEYWFVNFLYAP